MIKEIELKVRSEVLMKNQAGSIIDFLKINTAISGSGVGCKVLFLVFLDNSSQPSYIVKTIRTKRDIPVIKNGYENLCRLNKLFEGNEYNDLFPRALLIVNKPEYSWSLESFCFGRKSIMKNDLSIIFNSYILFSKRLRDYTGGSEILNYNYAERLINEFKGSHEVLSQIKKYCYQIFKDGEVVVPKIPQHGDFTSDNILINTNRISIIDCDIFGDILIPGYDIFHLLYRSKIGNKIDYLQKYFHLLGVDIPIDKRLLLIYFLHELYFKRDYIMLQENGESIIAKFEAIQKIFMNQYE
jgi:hypothetical protein